MFSEVTLAGVKKLISEEEYKQAARGEVATNVLNVSASDFIVSGIDLEDQL
jgi:hypothetical protein